MMNNFYDFVNEFNDMVLGNGYNTFPIDVVEADNKYLIAAEIPGCNKEDIKLDFTDGVLTIEAKRIRPDKSTKFLIHERNYNKVERKINFGDIDIENVKAKYENGLLEVIIDTKKPEVKEKKTIEIE